MSQDYNLASLHHAFYVGRRNSFAVVRPWGIITMTIKFNVVGDGYGEAPAGDTLLAYCDYPGNLDCFTHWVSRQVGDMTYLPLNT